jgi:hypothetical protein
MLRARLTWRKGTSCARRLPIVCLRPEECAENRNPPEPKFWNPGDALGGTLPVGCENCYLGAFAARLFQPCPPAEFLT